MALNRWLTDEEYTRAAANGIKRSTVYYRLYRSDKWGIEEALTAPPGTVRHKDERKYEKWVKKAKRNGINKRTFYSRVTILGWGCEEAATKPAKEMDSEKKYWLGIAKRNGINYQTFMSRVNIRGWGLQRAATMPVNNTGSRCSTKYKEETL